MSLHMIENRIPAQDGIAVGPNAGKGLVLCPAEYLPVSD